MSPVLNDPPPPMTIGDLIVTLYDSFREMYDDDERASVETAAVVNRLLSHHRGDTNRGDLIAVA